MAHAVPSFVLRRMVRLAREDTGADATEYALLAALIAVVIITGASNLGGAVGNALQSVANSVAALPTVGPS